MQLARILVGVDLTASSTRAALWAAREFAPAADVVLLHCLNPLLSSHAMADEHERAEACLADLEHCIGPERSSHRISLGDPARCLADLAADLDADLIVVGAHHDHPDRAPAVGSTAQALARCSPVPVLLCSETPTGTPRSLLLPLDASRVETALADWTHTLAEQFGARLVLAYVEPPHDRRLASIRRIAAHRESETTPWTRVTDGFAPDRVFVDAVLGERTDAVIAEAERFNSELVLLEAPSDAEAADASTSVDPLLDRSPCPVLVIPPLDNTLTR